MDRMRSPGKGLGADRRRNARLAGFGPFTATETGNYAKHVERAVFLTASLFNESKHVLVVPSSFHPRAAHGR